METRVVTDDERPAWAQAFATALGESWDYTTLTTFSAYVEPDRTLGTFDGERLVGTAGAFGTEVTVPDGVPVRAAAVTGVGVVPTHRRRGITHELIVRLLRDARERGEAVSVLEASEASIYGRWGYGAATVAVTAEIDRPHAAFSRPVPAGGRLALIDPQAAREVLPPIFDAARRRQPGELARSAELWESWFTDPVSWREGGGPLQHVVHEGASGPDGYVSYRVTKVWQAALPANRLTVVDLHALDPDVYARLWRYCLDVDLVGTVEAGLLAVDEPVWWLLRDPRRLRVTERHDGLWVRLVDVPGALAARRYPLDGETVVEVADALFEDNAGRWRLTVEGGRAACGRTDVTPDLALDVGDLGALYLGGVRPSTLARAGRLTASSAAALEHAELTFSSPVAPRCQTSF